MHVTGIWRGTKQKKVQGTKCSKLAGTTTSARTEAMVGFEDILLGFKHVGTFSVRSLPFYGDNPFVIAGCGYPRPGFCIVTRSSWV